MDEKTSDSLQILVVQIRRRVISKFCGEFVDLGLCLVPFFPTDRLSDLSVDGRKKCSRPSSWSGNRGALLSRRVLDSEVL